MTQRHRPITNLDFSALPLEDAIPELEFVGIERHGAEMENKFAKYSDRQLRQQSERFRGIHRFMSEKIIDRGDKLVKMVADIEAELHRRELAKKTGCMEMGSKITEAANSLVPKMSCFDGANQKLMRVESKEPRTTLPNGGFDYRRSNKMSGVPGSDCMHIVKQTAVDERQLCLRCKKVLGCTKTTCKVGTGPCCTQCQNQTRFSSVTPFQPSKEHSLDCPIEDPSISKGSAGKRVCLAVGESLDTAMELSDDEGCQMLKNPSLTVQTQVNYHRKRFLCLSFQRKEGLKTAYPCRSDPEAVEVLYSDLQHLAPFEFLNDTIIDFYIKYIQRPNHLSSERRKIFHFFNSFFYKKLFLGKRKNICSDPFSKLRKWTKGVNIFEKTYLLVPIHDSAHWSLVIVCFPKIAGCTHILHLDSMISGHVSENIFRLLKSYLEAEWKYSLKNCCGAAGQFLSVEHKMNRVEVPLQENESDCGLFLLYYIERFVQDSPLQFESNNLSKMFGRSWFKPHEASHLRKKIRCLVENLLEAERGDQSQQQEILMEDMD